MDEIRVPFNDGHNLSEEVKTKIRDRVKEIHSKRSLYRILKNKIMGIFYRLQEKFKV